MENIKIGLFCLEVLVNTEKEVFLDLKDSFGCVYEFQ